MTEILDILKYTLPALIVLIATVLIIKQVVKNDQNRRNYEIISKNQQIITPVRLQAYERLTLLLERLSPESLIMRVNKPNTILISDCMYEKTKHLINTKAWEPINVKGKKNVGGLIGNFLNNKDIK